MFEYIRVSDVRAKQMLSVPKMLLGSPVYEGLSIAAKVLYALLWEMIEQQGHGTAHIDQDMIYAELNCLSGELDGWLHELEAFELITMKDNAICIHPFHYEEV